MSHKLKKILSKYICPKPDGASSQKESNFTKQYLSQYCLLGHYFLSKGDYFLAKKMFLYANVQDPSNQSVLALIKSVADRKESLRKEKVSPEKKRKFDFYILPSGGGSSALIERLNLRPNFLVALKHEFDSAILEEKYDELLDEYNRRVPSGRSDIKMGLVQHAHIGVDTPSSKLLRVAKSIAGITNTSAFIQTVRDPISFISSNYFNHLLESGRFDLGLSFKFGNERSLFGGNEYFEIKTSSGSKAKLNIPAKQKIGVKEKACPKIDKAILAAAFSLIAKNAQFHRFGSITSQYFDRWITVDLCAEYKKESGGDIAKIMELLGSNSIPLPTYDEVAYGRTQRLMWRNWIVARYNEHTLVFTLGVADWCFGCSTFPFMEVAWSKNEILAKLLGLDENTTFSLNLNFDMWEALPTNLKQTLVDEAIFDSIMEEIFFPHWIQDYVIWSKTVETFKIEALSAQQLETLRSNINDDLSSFLKLFPRYEKLWPSVTRLFTTHQCTPS